MTKPAPSSSAKAKPVRCAIYTRKSTEEGLALEFNSLDAQRESAEAYVKSQGWTALPDRYDDGGFTGGNTDRPGLKQLMSDIEAGKVDCVVVYKVDRLSRSLMDFSRLMESFDTHNVSFVSVTQHFNTTHSMGRLTLNILLSFAQFEREIISERTRDKIAGARRRGKWAGGRPILGYDLVPGPGGSKLHVNADEAERVRAIFEMYLASGGGIMGVVAECARRGWTTKAWVSKGGKPQGGGTLDKGAIYGLLKNVLYTGRTRYKDETFPGEHDAIVPAETFDRVQKLLARNGRTGGSLLSCRDHALLRGLVRCTACGCPMTHNFTTKAGTSSSRRYRYYVCAKAQKQGRETCPAPSLPAGDLERFVVGTLKTALSGDAVVRRATELLAARRPDLVVDPDELVGAAESFDPVWDAMTPKERESLVRALIERVDFDGVSNTVGVTFREGVLEGIGTHAETTAA